MKYFNMIHENIEGYKEYYIDNNWYQNRKKGISVILRCYGDEELLGPSIESSFNLFDEFIVILTTYEGDRSREVLESFNSDKINIFEYPFKLHKGKDCSTDTKFKKHIGELSEIFVNPYKKRGSAHTFTYLSNYGLSKTSYSHIAHWDPDHILRPEYNTKEFHDLIISKDFVKCRGYNVVTDDFTYLSKKQPYHNFHPRFLKVSKYLFYAGNRYNLEELSIRSNKIQLKMFKNYFVFPIQQLIVMKNILNGKDVVIDEPIYFHTKFLNKSKILNDKYTNIEYYKKFEGSYEKGEKIDVDVPFCAYKNIEDYLEIIPEMDLEQEIDNVV